jgi:hypothetical protein
MPFLRQAACSGVIDDADDRGPRIAINSKPPADRARVGPEMPRSGPIDDDGLAGLHLGGREYSPFEQPDAERTEVVGLHVPPQSRCHIA